MFLGNIVIFVSLATILVAQSKGEKKTILLEFSKDQLNSEWIYEVIVSPKMQTKDFCPTKQTRIVAKKTASTHQKITKKVFQALFVW